MRLTRHQPLHARRVRSPAIGGFGALDDGGVAQGFEDLRRLAGEKFLLPLGLGDVREQPGGTGGHGQVSETMVAE